MMKLLIGFAAIAISLGIFYWLYDIHYNRKPSFLEVLLQGPGALIGISSGVVGISALFA
jgi:hypothetical protein